MAEAALRAAAGVLASPQSRRLTLVAVARVAGVSTASLRRFFPTPEALTGAVIDHQVSLKLERVGKRIATAERSPERALQTLVSELVEIFLGGRSQLFRILLHQDAAIGAEDPVLRSRAAVFALLARLPGAATPARRELAADAIVGILQGALDRSRGAAPLSDAERARLGRECAALLGPWLCPPRS